MCRPSCCDNSRSQGSGIAAIALIIGAAIVAVKIGPIVARIIHIAIEILRIAALTAAAVLAFAFMAWVAVRLVRWWHRHRKAPQLRVHPVTTTAREKVHAAKHRQDCLACGGNGEVLRASGNGGFRLRPCPECRPIRLAG
jgi:hypothetical protein